MDIAPDVSLYLTNVYTKGDLAAAVDWMIRQDVDVINVSLRYKFDGPGDGTSPRSYSPLKAVDSAVANGIVWVNAAGNQGNDSWLKRAPFSSTTISISGEETKAIIFDGEDFTNEFKWGRVELRWDDSWDGATTNLDLYVVDRKNPSDVTYSASDIRSSSRNLQLGDDGHTPYEVVWGSGILT